MTTFYNFQPSTLQVSQYQVTLDAAQYVLTLPWNLFGQRYYLTCSDLDGNLIFNLPLIGSPDGLVLQSLTWSDGLVTVETEVPHGYRAGTSVSLTVGGAAPDEYNGQFILLATGDNTLTYSLDTDPGTNTAAGILYDNINLGGGYFETSTLVYRTSSSQLEVTP